jgi:exodeoxyribonuclease V gamma subunit
LQQPLPIARKTAFAYLNESELKNAFTKAEKVYEGDGFISDGELGEDSYMQRFFPSFEILMSPSTFEAWAEVLYRPMLTRITEVAQ